MKGVVFDLLEQVISAEHGEDAWEALLDQTGVTGAFTAVGSYPDETLMVLVGAACDRFGTTPDHLVRWFGRSAMPLLAERYPAFFAQHDKTVSFLLTLNEVIHPEVRKLFPGAYAPSFEFDTTVPGGVALAYRSHRNLCSFAEGLIEGAADHFEEVATIERPSCAKRGDELCILRTTFTPA